VLGEEVVAAGGGDGAYSCGSVCSVMVGGDLGNCCLRIPSVSAT
jgi:hypothetical protein